MKLKQLPSFWMRNAIKVPTKFKYKKPDGTIITFIAKKKSHFKYRFKTKSLTKLDRIFNLIKEKRYTLYGIGMIIAGILGLFLPLVPGIVLSLLGLKMIQEDNRK
jgi:hypothetical protein